MVRDAGGTPGLYQRNNQDPPDRRGEREIVLDIWHLSLGFARRTPVGVDRVDMGFADHFLSSDVANRKAFLLTPFGPRGVQVGVARRLFKGVQAHWHETQHPERDRALVHIRNALATDSVPRRRAPAGFSRGLPRTVGVGLTVARLHATAWRQITEIGANAVYLNVSQYPLSRPGYFRWLMERPDIRPVFMIHDLLPIEYPEFFRPASVERHHRRLRTFARIAAGVIMSTPEVAESLLAYLHRLGRRTIPLLVQPLPVSSTFHQPRQHDESLAARPYFVICGTIEPRKNHLLLLNLWRELERSLGPDTPKLIVVGARGWENENILDLLERCPGLRDHVIEVPGLSTPSLKRLIDNARAVLMPSFAEGYGLPAAEAVAAGTPVVASDLASLRAIESPAITRLDPLDGLGWLAAIRRLSEGSAHWAQPEPVRPRSVFASEPYFERVEAFLATL
jgi:glycosyltransferase involved in cell wall biosynthesis